MSRVIKRFNKLPSFRPIVIREEVRPFHGSVVESATSVACAVRTRDFDALFKSYIFEPIENQQRITVQKKVSNSN